ncbi:hypothetical protein TIFTF001_000658 [Ficus carica]|uniref:Uncharacterized protein n=1 Tax=Ficus carica TaxID=3494 RepID=A0AA88CKF4_FICCA|nr:hypothetical protein TIFTF001_000658 [Ficus carica]
MVTVLAEVSPWQEDVRYGEEEGSKEIAGGGVWSSRTKEDLQQLGFDNLVSSSDVSYFYAELVMVFVLLSLDSQLNQKFH